MIRRVLLGSVLLAIAGGVGAAYADTPATPLSHEVCVVTSDDPQHRHTQDFCVTWQNPQLP